MQSNQELQYHGKLDFEAACQAIPPEKRNARVNAARRSFRVSLCSQSGTGDKGSVTDRSCCQDKVVDTCRCSMSELVVGGAFVGRF